MLNTFKNKLRVAADRIRNGDRKAQFRTVASAALYVGIAAYLNNTFKGELRGMGIDPTLHNRREFCKTKLFPGCMLRGTAPDVEMNKRWLKRSAIFGPIMGGLYVSTIANLTRSV